MPSRIFPCATAGVLRTLAVLLAAVSTSACLSIEETSSNFRYGSMTIRASAGGQGTVTARPTASFFTGPDAALPNSRVTSDQCSIELFAEEAFLPGNLTAGSSVELRVAGDVFELTEESGTPRLYTLGSSGTFSYSAGDTVTVTVPGAAGGFPGSQVRVRLAEPIRVGPQTPPTATSGDYAITWQTDGDENSGVLLSMRFGSFANEGRADRQLLCVLRDDGAFTVPASFMVEYFSSVPNLRSINVLRWRTRVTNVDERTRFYIVSSTDTTVFDAP